MITTTVQTLVRKVAALLPGLEERGPVYLFALGEREGIDRWDVILSAEWSDRNYADAVRVVADALVKSLVPSELTMLASVAVIPSSEPNILDMPKSLGNVSPEEEKVIEFTLMGLEIRRAFIFKAQSPPLAGKSTEMMTAVRKGI